MTPRTFEEVLEAVFDALHHNDAPLLFALADELDALGTEVANAASLNAKGAANFILARHNEALALYKQSLAEYERIGVTTGVAAIHANIGNCYRISGDKVAALEHYQRAYDRYSAANHIRGVASVLSNIGGVYTEAGDYATALRYATQCLDSWIQLSYADGEAQACVLLGQIHGNVASYATALEFYHRAYSLLENSSNQFLLTTTISHIGQVYLAIEQFKRAAEYFEKVLLISDELQLPRSQVSAHLNLGIALTHLGDVDNAIAHMTRSLNISKEIGYPRGITSATINLAQLYIDQQRFDEGASIAREFDVNDETDPKVKLTIHSIMASVYDHEGTPDLYESALHSALSLAEQHGLLAEKAALHLRLRDTARKNANFEQYLLHNDEYTQITTQINGKETTQRLTMMEAERTMEAERRERDKERALLYGALPKTVAERMVRGETVSGDHFTHAAVLFADIAGFTSNSANLDASDVVTLLGQVFHEFDRICELHGVTKVKTIGDAYMCFKGDASAEENAQAVAHVALAIVRTTFTWPTGAPLSFRVGIHIGQATAGVIGTQRLQYDVWGDTVNVASRMESTGEPGRIHVTEAFAEGATPHTFAFTFIERGKIDIKGKGFLNTYWLVP